MYTFNSRIRYSEVNRNKTLDLASIINYFQDCSTFQSEDLGMGLEYLASKHRAWLLNSWQIIVYRFPSLFEKITTGTWAYDFKSMYGYRNFMIQDEFGKLCAVANSIWVYIDTTTHRPIRITEQDISAYGSKPKFPMNYAQRKIELPEQLTEFPSFPVVMANIDTNNHVNNGQYIKMAEEYLPPNSNIKQMRAEYKHSAVLGDTIKPFVSISDEMLTVILTDIVKRPYAIIEFSL